MSVELGAVGTATVVELGPLGPGDVAELAEAARVDSGIAEELHLHTRGLPLFVVEYLEMLAEKESVLDRPWPLPAGLRDALRVRLLTVSDLASQILVASAAIGRDFDEDTVRLASGRSEEETVAALEELVGRALITERDGAFVFAHEQLRTLVYDGTDRSRRRLLHRRIAQALLRRGTETNDAAVGLHYELAGDHQLAAECYAQAGQAALRLYANRDALAHLRRAITLDHPDAATLHELVGDIETLEGDYAAALASYETAAALGAELGVVELKLGGVQLRRGRWELAESHLDAADARLPEGTTAARALLAAERTMAAYRRGQREQARAHLECAFELAKALGDRRALAKAHNTAGVLATGIADYAQAGADLQTSLELAEAIDDVTGRAAALNNLAHCRRLEGDFDKGLELAERALELCELQGDTHRQAALNSNVADLMHALGRDTAAVEHLKKAATLFAAVGEADALEPEVWKLVDW